VNGKLSLRIQPSFVIWLVVGAIAAMAITGWVIAAASDGQGRQRFRITVINDRDTKVAAQPCARYFCDSFRPIDLAAGASYTWLTTGGDAGIRSFVIEAAPNGRILGCVAQNSSVNRSSNDAVYHVSALEKCAN
jgi:hypothetical protein